MPKLASYNGKVDAIENIKVSPMSRAFLFSDSVYEVIPSYNNKLFLFDEHLARLESSLSIINIPIPDFLKNLRPLIMELVKKNQFLNL